MWISKGIILRQVIWFLCGVIFAFQDLSASNQISNQILEVSKLLSGQTFYKRIDGYSHALIGTPYGNIKYYIPNSDVVDSPEMLIDYVTNDEFTYDFERLDCVTYLETVLALSLIDDKFNGVGSGKKEFSDQFEVWLKKIRYLNADPTYLKRNHFTSIDWIPNNTWLWTDVTKDIDPSHETATCRINKKNWVWHQKPFKEFSDGQNDETKNNLRQKVDELLLSKNIALPESVLSELPYISIHKLVDNMDTFSQRFPDIAIVSIVRPNWNLEKFIGTNINISHQGFSFKRNGEIWFRHASDRGEKKVLDILLKDYLEKFLDSPTIKGIHVLSLREHPVKIN